MSMSMPAFMSMVMNVPGAGDNADNSADMNKNMNMNGMPYYNNHNHHNIHNYKKNCHLPSPTTPPKITTVVFLGDALLLWSQS